MKRSTALICISLLFFIMVGPVSADATEAIIQADHLNVRSGPGTDYDTIGQVNTDDVYPVMSQKDDWIEIDFGDETGWVTDEYVTLTDSGDMDDGKRADKAENNDQDSPEQTTEKEVVIQNDNTQIRDEPSTDGQILFFASENETFNLVSKNDEWYEIEHDNGKGFVHHLLVDNDDENNKVTGLENKTIVLDAGHGGRDVGAIGTSGSYEKTFTYLTTTELKKQLEWLGANVVLTRDADEYISLGGRTSLANIKDTDALISIHYNSTPDLPQVSGIGTYYYHKQNKELAKAVQNGVIHTTEANDRGVAFENFHVIRQSFKPSILIELGFISNEDEESRLKGAPYQQKIVTGIVNGLQQYFSE